MEIDFVVISGILGALTPLIVSLIKNDRLSTQAKRVIAMLVAAIMAYIQIGVEYGWTTFDWKNLVLAFGVIYGQAQIFYKGFWEDTVVDKSLTSALYKSSSELTPEA